MCDGCLPIPGPSDLIMIVHSSYLIMTVLFSQFFLSLNSISLCMYTILSFTFHQSEDTLFLFLGYCKHCYKHGSADDSSRCRYDFYMEAYCHTPKKYPCALCIYVFFIIDNNCIITVINSHQLLFLLG